MDRGTKVYRAYAVRNSLHSNGEMMTWMDEMTVTGVELDGVPVISDKHGSLCKLTPDWTECKADAIRKMRDTVVEAIGKLQAQADRLADEALHVDLTTEATN